jgi:dihydrofolate reductase
MSSGGGLMGKIIVSAGVSADGFYEGPDRDISWHRVDDELHRHMNAKLAQMSTFLMGRVNYELMESVWPTADQNPEFDESMQEFAPIWRDIPKVVYSRTLEQVGANATLVREVVPDEVREIAARGDAVVGGADLAASFQRLGLIDEYQVYVMPVAIGSGRRLFPDDRIDLHLEDARPFGNGVVLLRYSCGR